MDEVGYEVYRQMEQKPEPDVNKETVKVDNNRC